MNITNCNISKASADHIRHWQKKLPFIELPITVISGIALEAVDGASINDVTISDITMKDVQTPIFIVLGNRSRKPVRDTSYRVGEIKNVLIKNIVATSHSKISSSITGIPGNNVSDITLENITISNIGGGTKDDAAIILPEKTKAYPENRMYGSVFPSSGLYIRHVKNITVKNFSIENRNKDERPIFYVEDADSVNIDGLKSENVLINPLKIINSKNVQIFHSEFPVFNKDLVELIDTQKEQVKIVK